MQPQKGSLWCCFSSYTPDGSRGLFPSGPQQEGSQLCESWVGVLSLCGRGFTPGTLAPPTAFMPVYQNKRCFQDQTDGLLASPVQAISSQLDGHVSGQSGWMGRYFTQIDLFYFFWLGFGVNVVFRFNCSRGSNYTRGLYEIFTSECHWWMRWCRKSSFFSTPK